MVTHFVLVLIILCKALHIYFYGNLFTMQLLQQNSPAELRASGLVFLGTKCVEGGGW